MKHALAIVAVMAVQMAPNTALADDAIRILAAGSLKAVLPALTEAFKTGNPELAGTELVYAASGLLRERIEGGERADVFLSADLGHPRKLAEQGKVDGDVVVFARNSMCALVRSGLTTTSATLLDVMLDPATRVGTSTPKADPSGDYAVALFAKAQSVRPGSTATLTAKALQLTGGPTSLRAPDGQNQYAWIMGSRQADVFLTYCTNAVLAKAEIAELQIVPLPAELAVGASYGLAVLAGSKPAAKAFAAFLNSRTAGAIIAKHGFEAVSK